jgi:hypothetical protein
MTKMYYMLLKWDTEDFLDHQGLHGLQTGDRILNPFGCALAVGVI